MLTLMFVGASLLPMSESLSKILNVFHPKKNLETIYIVGPSEFPEINGLKIVGASIILFFHVVYFSSYKLSSRFLGIVLSESASLSIITNGAVFVDMFLVMR